MLKHLVNRLWLNRRIFFGSLSVLFAAVVIHRNQYPSPDHDACINILPVKSNEPSYSKIQFYLFNSDVADQNVFTNGCINELAGPDDIILVDSIAAGSKVSCETYKLPSIDCEGWDATSYIEKLWADSIADEQMLFVRMFKSQWQQLQNAESTDQILQHLIDNNLHNPYANISAKKNSPEMVANLASENQIKALKAIQKLRNKGESYEDIFAYYENGQQKSNSIAIERANSLVKTLEKKQTEPYGRIFIQAKAVLANPESAKIVNNYLDTLPADSYRYAVLQPG